MAYQSAIYNPTGGVLIDIQLRGGCKLIINLYNYLDIHVLTGLYVSRYSPHHSLRGD